MVRAYRVDPAILELAPEAEPQRIGTQRRKALGGGPKANDILICQEKVVGAGLNRNVRAAIPGVPRQRDALRAAYMNDMVNDL